LSYACEVCGKLKGLNDEYKQEIRTIQGLSLTRRIIRIAT
jgi:hypothetical protein